MSVAFARDFVQLMMIPGTFCVERGMGFDGEVEGDGDGARKPRVAMGLGMRMLLKH
jgi:hypothetical protein